MYKQKSWNIKDVHMGFIKAFIVISMLLVCVFSLKMDVRAEGVGSQNGIVHHIVLFDDNGSRIMDYSYEFFNASYYYFFAHTSSDIYKLFCYSFEDGTISDEISDMQMSIFFTYSDGSTYFQKPVEMKRYSFASFWFDNLLESTFNIFDSEQSAVAYIENGDTSGLLYSPVIVPSFSADEKYDSSYMFTDFDCGELYGAAWTGVTDRSMELDSAVTEKVLVRVAYKNDSDEIEYLKLAVVDTSGLRWSELKDSVIEKITEKGGDPKYLDFTPYYYTPGGQIYYGRSVQYKITASHGGSVVQRGDDGYFSFVTNGNAENTLGYLQGVKRQLVFEIGFSGFVITWDVSNSELNDCRVEVVVRFRRSELFGSTTYCTVPYLEYENAASYSTGYYKFSSLDLVGYYKDNYHKSGALEGSAVDAVLLRLVRYDADTDSYSYGGFVSVDPHTVDSDNIGTVVMENGGSTTTDDSSPDSYTDDSGGIFGSDDVFSRDAVGTSVTNIISSLDSTQKFLGSGSFDAFLKTSFSFIPLEIWSVIISGLSVTVSFLFIKIILKVL